MKRLFLLLAGILALSLPAAAQKTNFSTVVLTNVGRPVAGAKVTVCNHHSTAPNPCTDTSGVIIYSDVEGLHAIANPASSDGYGNVFIFLTPGTYDYTIAGNGIITQTFKGLTLANQASGGSVLSVSGLSPLFTVANPTTTAVFSLSNAGANTVFGNCTGAPAAPSYCSLVTDMLPSLTSSTVTSFNSVTGAVTLAAGSNIIITPSGNTFTISAFSSASCSAAKGGYALTAAAGVFTCTEIIPPVLKKGSNGGNYVGASGSFSAVDGTNLAYTVTIPTGSNLTIKANGNMSPTGGTSTWYVALFDGASKLTEQALTWTAAGSSNSCPGTMNCGSSSFGLNYVIAGDNASHTIQLEYATEAASNDTSGRILNSNGIFPTMLFTVQ